MRRKLLAEGAGSLLLAAAVIGSGLMAERLSGGNVALALLANTAATVAALGALIATLGPVSGAHFNPAVSLSALWVGRLGAREACAYSVAQIAGCCGGALLAHAMFDHPLIEASTRVRSGPGQWLSEIVATSGLVLVVLGARTIGAAAWRVPAWIGAAYWFTASTSFANPAITLARSLSDTFAGIRPIDAPGFIAAQVAGAALGCFLANLLGFSRAAEMQIAAPSGTQASSSEAVTSVAPGSE